MTTNVTQATRGAAGWNLAIVNPDPVDGLGYLNYFANQPGGYNVTITTGGGFDNYPYTDYYVFRIGDNTGTASDTISTNNAGTFEAREGNDVFFNNAFNPFGSSASRSVRFFGGNGDDQFNIFLDYDPTFTGATVVYGGSGNDLANGGYDDDILYGDTTNSYLFNPGLSPLNPSDLAPYDTSRDGDDILAGYGGNDLLSGDGGDDQLFGGNGSDTLLGGDGSDFLYGGPRGAGNLDLLTGGTGADVFSLSYSQDTSNGGGSFWNSFLAKTGQDIANNEVKIALQNGIKDAGGAVVGGILGAALGPIGGDLAAAFVSLVESLAAGPTPKQKQDVMVVTDFDPREDVLQLPLQNSITSALTFQPVGANQIPGGINSSTTEQVMQFSFGGQIYAYVQLSADFLADMGLTGAGGNTVQVLNNLFEYSSSVAMASNGLATFTNLAPLNSKLPGGGFQPVVSASLPANSTVQLFGAIGGQVRNWTANSGAVLAGTNYTDVLSGNQTILGVSQPISGKQPDPSKLTLADLKGYAAYIYGFGGADLIYGTGESDQLYGGDGDDVIWSFLAGTNTGGPVAETISGGDGDDLLIGGNSAGTFDGGTGSDTFSVVYLNNVSTADGFFKPMQLVVDLVAGYAAEQFSDFLDLFAPVGPPPFQGTGQAEVPNSYTLTGIENAIGGPLNDWIRAASGSMIEGAQGADYLLAEAVDGVTLSYQGSEDGVSVQIFEDGASSSGGDAEGDVIGTSTPTGGAPFFSLPFQATNFDGLLGSAANDTLGAYLSNVDDSGDSFIFTGNGGTDVFQITGAEGEVSVTITDFDNQSGSGDKIDLRPLGTTAADIFITSSGAVVGGNEIIVITTGGTDSPSLTLADFLVATPVSGVAQSRKGGDALAGGAGPDLITGSSSQDFLFGNGGQDVLLGCAGDDVLDGGAGRDRLSGGRGADRLRGGAGRDWLDGGNGDDLLDGGAGADEMRGGRGADTFLLRYGEIDGDRIADFRRLEGDRLAVVGSGPLSVVGLGGGAFSISDGVTTETITVFNAAQSDFIML